MKTIHNTRRRAGGFQGALGALLLGVFVFPASPAGPQPGREGVRWLSVKNWKGIFTVRIDSPFEVPERPRNTRRGRLRLNRQGSVVFNRKTRRPGGIAAWRGRARSSARIVDEHVLRNAEGATLESVISYGGGRNSPSVDGFLRIRRAAGTYDFQCPNTRIGWEGEITDPRGSTMVVIGDARRLRGPLIEGIPLPDDGAVLAGTRTVLWTYALMWGDGKAQVEAEVSWRLTPADH